ncbi:MAG: virulence-associated E family protein [Cyanobacteria bacterium P01_E01_bin.42]
MTELNLDWNYIESNRVEGKRDRTDIEIHCPACGAENFKINRKTGKYDAYGCNCMEPETTRKEIARALLLPTSTPSMPIGSKQPQLKRKMPVQQSEQQIKIRRSNAQTPAIIYEPPAWGTQEYRNLKRTIAKECEGDNVTLKDVREVRFPYDYLPNGQFKRWVSRFEWTNEQSTRDKAIARHKSGKSHEKTIRQGHIDEEGAIRWSKGDKPWEPYRIEDAMAAEGNVLLIVEGETATDAMYCMGLAAVTLQGNTWGEVGMLCDLPDCNLFVFLTDADDEGDAKGEKFVKAMEEKGRKAIAISMRKLFPELALRVKGFDAVDVENVAIKTNNEFIQSFITRLEREVSSTLEGITKNNILTTNKTTKNNESKKESKVNRAIRLIEQVLGSVKIRRNKMSQAIELDSEPGKPFNLRDLWFDIQTKLNENIPLSFLEQVGACLADSNDYHPVRDYLESCSEEKIDFIDNLSSRFLGNNLPISNVMVKKFLIGAVARIFDPGCKMDSALILKGDQGIGKSSFFRELGGAFFNDSMGDISNKDDLLTAQAGWINEWPELETIFTRADVSKTKSFLSRQKDFLRLPYGRNVEEIQRSFVIAGTTNEDSFLRDPTGSRRFWILEMFLKLNIEQLRKERDRIWGAAVTAYKAGESWVLTEQEQSEADRIAAQFNSQDPWEEAIAEHLGNCLGEEVSVKQLLDKVLSIDIGKQTVQLASRVGRILVGLGWKKIRKRIEGIRQYLYRRENSDRIYDEETNSEEPLAIETPPAHSVSTFDTECAGEQADLNPLVEPNPLAEIESVKAKNETGQEVLVTQEAPVTRILVTGESESLDFPSDDVLPDNPQRTKVLSKEIKGLLVLEDTRKLFQLRDKNFDIWQDAIARLKPDKRSQLKTLLEEVA